MQPSTAGVTNSQQPPVRLAAPGQAQTFEPGPIGVRFLALVIDGIIVSVITLPVQVVLTIVMGVTIGHNPSAGATAAMIQLLTFVFSVGVTFLYNGFFYRSKGATPGKLLFGLRVVDAETGTFIGWGQTFMRETIGRFVDAITLMIGVLIAVFRQDRRALHDLIAGTQVLRVKK